MDKLDILTTPLLPTEREVLLLLTDRSNIMQSRIIVAFPSLNGLVTIEGEIELPSPPDIKDGMRNLEALNDLGYIVLNREDVVAITLLPSAYTRARHERRSALIRKFEVFRLRQSRNLALWAFFISLVLAVLRVLEFFGVQIVR